MQQYSTLIFIALLVAAFYFLILRPQRKRQQALQHTMSALSPGSRVMLGSGVFGTVVSVGPRQVVLEISPGAELTVLKQAISKIVTEDDEDELEEDELEEGVTSLDEPIELQTERPFEEPTAASNTEPAAEPDSSSTPRDSKPPAAD
ncbi:MAG TPA: preprotein translocase subunit YajC [Propionibacteriaceae bacterium]|jgi:preprotein translocase subunit YajC|nr:preprotein translocase subunit YajC [Propionibacteriaceae bacterium]HMI34367.1 preprotein translocase subunit YajC [Propionibacteriaceae bacterium]